MNEPKSETLLNSSASNHALVQPRALQVNTRKNSVNRRITQLTAHVIQDHSVNSKMSCTGKTWSLLNVNPNLQTIVQTDKQEFLHLSDEQAIKHITTYMQGFKEERTL